MSLRRVRLPATQRYAWVRKRACGAEPSVGHFFYRALRRRAVTFRPQRHVMATGRNGPPHRSSTGRPSRRRAIDCPNRNIGTKAATN